MHLQVCYGTDDWDVLMWAQDTLPGGDPVSFLNRIGNEAGSMAKIAQFDPSADTDAKVTESARACTCYSVCAGSNSGTPRLQHFCLYQFWLYHFWLYHFWLYQFGCSGEFKSYISLHLSVF